MVTKIFISILLLLFLAGCQTPVKDNGKIEYSDWMMINAEGKPVYGGVISKDRNKINTKDYYKIFYRNNKIKKIETYNNDIMTRTDFMNSKGICQGYIIEDLNHTKSCNVRYISKKNIAERIAECNDGSKVINRYLITKIKTDRRTIYSYKLIETSYFINDKIERKVISDYDNGNCKEYNKNNKLVKHYECYSYEETRPLVLKI